MTNTPVASPSLEGVQSLIRLYVGVVVATVAALIVLRLTDAHLATSDAWGHAVIVAVFAVLLPLRLRSARAGNRSGLRAVGLIAGVLLIVNAVEASLTMFPLWMRVEMVLIAILMAGVVTLVSITAARHH